jgi:tRNA U55 pseudouridine synthase TruB
MSMFHYILMLLEYKEAGITINQFINKIKEKYINDKIAYAGRLDPMARGYIPILFNNECYNMTKYTNMKKIYRVKVIIGIQTDTDDPLGIIQNINPSILPKDCFNLSMVNINQAFHYYSTKSINQRRRNIANVDKHNVILYKSSVISTGIIPTDEFINTIISTINCIDKTKNFRQEEIINQWSKIQVPIEYIELELDVSSGFFVRQFIRDTSISLDIPLMCYDIWRTKLINI